MRISEYALVRGDSIAEFEEHLNARVRQGWCVDGELQVVQKRGTALHARAQLIYVQRLGREIEVAVPQGETQVFSESGEGHTAPPCEEGAEELLRHRAPIGTSLPGPPWPPPPEEPLGSEEAVPIEEAAKLMWSASPAFQRVERYRQDNRDAVKPRDWLSFWEHVAGWSTFLLIGMMIVFLFSVGKRSSGWFEFERYDRLIVVSPFYLVLFVFVVAIEMRNWLSRKADKARIDALFPKS
jgi:hypothetical protein